MSFCGSSPVDKWWKSSGTAELAKRVGRMSASDSTNRNMGSRVEEEENEENEEESTVDSIKRSVLSTTVSVPTESVSFSLSVSSDVLESTLSSSLQSNIRESVTRPHGPKSKSKTLLLELNFWRNNLKSTGVHDGMGWKGGWGGPHGVHKHLYQI